MTLDPALPPPWSALVFRRAAPELDAIFARRKTAASADFASPSLGTFDKSGRPPDVYANLFAHREGFALVDGHWDTSKTVVEQGGFYVMVAEDEPERAQVEAAAVGLAKTWEARAVGRKERTWAAKLGPDNVTPVDPSLPQARLRPDVAIGWTMLDVRPGR